MTGRNERCPCGSGKKFKRCCIGKNPRTRSVVLDLRESRPVDSASYDPKTGEVAVYYRGERLYPVSARLEITYPRKKGSKVTVGAEFAGNVVADIHRVLDTFDVVAAVDTNTRHLEDGRCVSVTCLVIGRPDVGRVPDHTLIHFGAAHCIEFWGAHTDAERIGWAEVVAGMQRGPEFNRTRRIAMIVDSHLGLLGKINKREEPVFGDTFLPTNVSLIYASTDASNDSLANKMLSFADAEANGLLDHVVGGGSEGNLEPVTGKPYSHLRLGNRRNEGTFSSSLTLKPIDDGGFQ